MLTLGAQNLLIQVASAAAARQVIYDQPVAGQEVAVEWMEQIGGQNSGQI